MTARSSPGWWVSGTEARSTSSPHPEPCDAHHRHPEHHRRLRRRRPRPPGRRAGPHHRRGDGRPADDRRRVPTPGPPVPATGGASRRRTAPRGSRHPRRSRRPRSRGADRRRPGPVARPRALQAGRRRGGEHDRRRLASRGGRASDGRRRPRPAGAALDARRGARGPRRPSGVADDPPHRRRLRRRGRLARRARHRHRARAGDRSSPACALGRPARDERLVGGGRGDRGSGRPSTAGSSDARSELSSAAREALGSAGDIDTSIEVLSGGAIPRLLEASAGADLVVLGSRRWARLAHVVLGSVSEPVVRKSTCPTLVVPRRRRDAVDDDSHLTASARS